MISKELLSEVFGEKRVILDYEVSINKTEIHYGHKDIDEDGFINIYELANKCKEWALSQGYMMKIENHYLNSIQIQIRKSVANSKYIEPWKKTFKSEVEAVIKACQWILDNKESK